MTQHAGTDEKLRKIREGLAQGATTSEIARSLGLSSSAVSQIKSSQNFASVNDKYAHMDDLMDSVEMRLVERFNQLLDSGLLSMGAKDILTAFRTINGAKRRSLHEGGPSTVINETKVVRLQLPESFMHKMIRNENNEIIAVDGKSLITIDPTKLGDLQNEQRIKLQLEHTTNLNDVL